MSFASSGQPAFRAGRRGWGQESPVSLFDLGPGASSPLERRVSVSAAGHRGIHGSGAKPVIAPA